MRKTCIGDKIKSVYFPLVAIIVALVIGGLVMQIAGYQSILAITSLITGAFGGFSEFMETLNKAIPLMLTALSYAFAKRCGIINLGAEGQLYIGALFATLAGTNYAGLPMFLHIPLTLAAGFLGGALYGLIIGLLKAKFGASELITTIMFNYIAIAFCGWLIAGPIKDTSGSSNFPQSRAIYETAQLPKLFQGTRLHAGIIVALLAQVVYYVFVWKSKKGFEMRVIGKNPYAAEYAGMKVVPISLLSIFIAGGFAGLGGAVELMGVQMRLMDNFSSNFGFAGVAVALLGNNTAMGIGFAGVLFGALRSGANKMQMMTNVPTATIYMIQGLIILFVIGRAMFDFSRWFQKPKQAISVTQLKKE